MVLQFEIQNFIDLSVFFGKKSLVKEDSMKLTGRQSLS